MTENKWETERGKFSIGFIFSTIFFIVSFFSTPIYRDSELILSEKIFEKAEFHGGKIDDVEIRFYGENEVYEIHRIEKQYLNKKQFLKVKVGDTILISSVDKDIIKMNYKGIELMDKVKADIHKTQNRNFVRYLSLTAMIFFLIPALKEEQPTFIFFRNKYELRFDRYIIGLLVILLIIVAILVGNPNPSL